MTDSKSRQNVADKNGPVLVAMDFAPDSEAALLWACGYAASVDAGLVVLHVVHDPGDAPGSYRTGGKDPLRPMADVAAQMMDECLEKVAKAHPELTILQSAEKVLVEGVPETRIIEVAQAKGARLIAMGSRGRSGLPHLLLGSKAERVVQMAPMPVTVVKADVADD